MLKTKRCQYLKVGRFILACTKAVRLFGLTAAPAGAIWSLVILLVVSGCNDPNKSASAKKDEWKRSTLVRNAARPDILIVGGETITCNDVINAPIEQDTAAVSLAERLKPLARKSSFDDFKKSAAPMVEQQVRNQVSNILLYQEAKRYIDKDVDEPLEKAAEKELRKFIMRYGGDEAKAEAALRQMGMNRESFKEGKKKSLLIEYYVGSMLPDNRPITYGELTKAYDQMKKDVFLQPAALTFRLIDIEVAKVDVTEPNQDPLTKSRELANQLLKRIQAGEDFGKLAKQYSHDYRREFGGLWRPKNPSSLAKPYDVLATEAEKMELGQVAGPIEAQGHIFIMKLEEKRPETYEPLEAVQELVKEKIITDRRRQAIEQLNAKVMQQAAVIQTDRFIDFCLEEIYRTNRQ